MNKRLAISIYLFFALCSSGKLWAQTNDSSVGTFEFFNSGGFRGDIDRIYNPEFYRDSTYIYTAPAGAEVWIPRTRRVYGYDGTGNHVRTETASRIEGQWKREALAEITYDDNQFSSVKITSLWNDETEIYEKRSREIYKYDDFGLSLEVITESWEIEGWRPAKKVSLNYDASHFLLSEETWEWVINENIWQPSKRILYDYNENDYLETEIHQVRDDSTLRWINDYNKEFEYNDEGMLIGSTRSLWDTVENEWVETSFLTWEYNAQGKIRNSKQFSYADTMAVAEESSEVFYDISGNLGSTILSLWSDEDNAWEPFEKQIHYWSEHANGNIRSNTGIRCYFPNPYSGESPWNCTSMKAGVNYTLDVYDLQGRLFHSQIIGGDHTFRIDGSVPDGLYLVVIRGGMDIHAEKVYFEN